MKATGGFGHLPARRAPRPRSQVPARARLSLLSIAQMPGTGKCRPGGCSSEGASASLRVAGTWDFQARAPGASGIWPGAE